METIGPIQNQEINILGKDLGSNKIDQNRKSPEAALSSSPDFVVIARIVQIMNNYLNIMEIDVNIKAYKINDEIIVRAISKENGAIIKTISPDKLLTLNTKISDMIGFLVNVKV
jgi:uncharacterized FlaG/YvyC family protein